MKVHQRPLDSDPKTQHTVILIGPCRSLFWNAQSIPFNKFFERRKKKSINTHFSNDSNDINSEMFFKSIDVSTDIKDKKATVSYDL